MEFLKENNGQYSSNRIMFIVGLIWAMSVSTIMMFTMGITPGEFIAVFSATSGVFVGLKIAQKPMEQKHKKE